MPWPYDRPNKKEEETKKQEQLMMVLKKQHVGMFGLKVDNLD